MKTKTLITNDLDSTEISKIVDIIYDELLINNSDFKYIKILIKFYDQNDNLIKPYLFLKDKENVSRYKYHNYLFSKLNYFINKNFRVKIHKYKINITIL